MVAVSSNLCSSHRASLGAVPRGWSSGACLDHRFPAFQRVLHLQARTNSGPPWEAGAGEGAPYFSFNDARVGAGGEEPTIDNPEQATCGRGLGPRARELEILTAAQRALTDLPLSLETLVRLPPSLRLGSHSGSHKTFIFPKLFVETDILL